MTVRLHTSCKPELQGLMGYKYDEMTIFKTAWDYESLVSRGIVYDLYHNVVAFPFVKFFNYEELFDGTLRASSIRKAISDAEPILMTNYGSSNFLINMRMPFYVTEKIDGCLGIAFFWNGKWYVKTGGSFDSYQAEWATEWIRRNADISAMDNSRTYLFEIVYKQDIHPLTKYYSEGLYLIGVTETNTGIELPLSGLKSESLKIKIPMPAVYEFKSMEEVYNFAKALPFEHEGVVVTFENGFKLKIKGNEFLELQKKFHSLNIENVFDHLALDAELRHVIIDKDTAPEEYPDLSEKAARMADEINALLDNVWEAASVRRDSPRKEVYEYFMQIKLISSMLIKHAYSGKEFVGTLLSIYYHGKFLPECFFKSLKHIWKPSGIFSHDLDDDDI